MAKINSFRFALVATLFLFGCHSLQPIKSIDIQVLPYYVANYGQAVIVKVNQQIDPFLLQNTQQGYKKAVEIIETQPQFVSPVTMFTLSARAYDLGLRDESVKWFYRGQNRLITALIVLDLPKAEVMKYTAFSAMIERIVNAYAFCDLDKQQKIASEQVQWVKDNPYQAIFLTQLPSQKSNRKQALQEAETRLDDRLLEQAQFFKDTQKYDKWKQQRQQNQMEQRFCWK